MLEVVVSYWLAVIPTAVAGIFLVGVLKKLRDEKAEGQKVPMPIEVRRK